jgi:hypothetical protein
MFGDILSHAAAKGVEPGLCVKIPHLVFCRDGGRQQRQAEAGHPDNLSHGRTPLFAAPPFGDSRRGRSLAPRDTAGTDILLLRPSGVWVIARLSPTAYGLSFR